MDKGVRVDQRGEDALGTSADHPSCRVSSRHGSSMAPG